MSRPFDLVVFDWDGTLIDSVPRILQCFKETFAAFNLPAAPEELIRAQIGLPLTASFPILVPDSHGISLDAWVDAYRVSWLDEARIPVSPLFPGVPELLQELSATVPLAIATGKSRAGLERELSRYQLHAYFPHSRCANETRPKPDPEMLEQLIALYGVTPSRTLMIGDTALDLNMARAAGTYAVGVTTGGQPRHTLEAAQPAHLFDSILQIRSLFPPTS